MEIGSREEQVSFGFQMKACFYRLLSELFERGASEQAALRKPKYRNIAPGVDMLHRCCTEDISVSELASACNISVSSFRELFTSVYGMPPIKYRARLRIKRAKYLLSTGNFTVAEVADAVGFGNVTYFCRCYKKITGESPSKAFQTDA